VRFPDGPRLDTGLLELFWSLAVAALFLALGRRPRPPGLFLGLLFALYGPARFVLDGLRVGEATHLGLTPGQSASIVATLGGAALLLRITRRRGSGRLQQAG
jgi:phosphatidylglycerol:prolipoprotein diacylglycerol transferase